MLSYSVGTHPAERVTNPSLDPPSISVVVPVFNGAATLPELVRRIESALDGLSSSLELILVNDGSDDESWDVIAELCGRHEWILGVDLVRNVGQLEATYCGARMAEAELTVTMDDDLQHPPEEVATLLAPLAAGCDLVYGSSSREHRGFLRRAGSSTLRLALPRLTGRQVAEHASSFRAYRTKLLREADDGSTALIDAYLFRATDRIHSVRVRREARGHGASGYRLPSLVRLAAGVVAGFRSGGGRNERSRFEVRRTLNAHGRAPSATPDADS